MLNGICLSNIIIQVWSPHGLNIQIICMLLFLLPLENMFKLNIRLVRGINSRLIFVLNLNLCISIIVSITFLILGCLIEWMNSIGRNNTFDPGHFGITMESIWCPQCCLCYSREAKSLWFNQHQCYSSKKFGHIASQCSKMMDFWISMKLV